MEPNRKMEPKQKEKMMVRFHELLMDMITEHNYGVPIPLNKEMTSHMEDIHTGGS